MKAFSPAVLVRSSRALVGRLALFCLTVPAEGQTPATYSSYPGYPSQGTYPSQPSTYPPAQPAATSKIQKLSEKVAQLSANDQRQDIRLHQLERDVDRIQQPGSAPKPSLESGYSPAPNLIPFTTYQVRKGDSLWRIAMHHRVSPGELISFNRMTNDTVREGQVLMIPPKGGSAPPPLSLPPPAMPGTHIVQPNETYFSIARRYGVTTDALAKTNPNVNPSKLQPGMQLNLPGKKTAPPPMPTSQPSAPTPNLSQNQTRPSSVAPSANPPGTHLVQPGESLSVIAHRYRVAMTTLQQANNIADANTLRAGQQLVIPTNHTSSLAKPPPAAASTHPAPKKKEKSPAAASPPPAGTDLAQAPAYPSPLPSRPVEPAPPSPPPSPAGLNRQVVSYRMEKGDTVETVAKDFGTSATEIRRLNRLSATSSLKEGDEILVPGMGAVN